MNIKFTIFTPTYNRAQTLERLYHSLLQQENASLEWLIIDDGSIDNTQALVTQLQAEGKLTIHYHYQENAGKQMAWNQALRLAKGEWFIGLDSDDTLIADALVKLDPMTASIVADNQIIGIRCLALRESTRRPDAPPLSPHPVQCSYFQELSDARLIGERIDVFKTTLIRAIPYPEIPDCQFIPEMWLYVEIAKKYQFLYTPLTLRLFYDHHHDNRLSRSSVKQYAIGHYLSRTQVLRYVPWSVFLKNLLLLVKSVIRAGQCAAWSGMQLKRLFLDCPLPMAFLATFSWVWVKGLSIFFNRDKRF